jgi:GAF domain-containing protein
MPPAPRPANERERLAGLQESGLVEGGPNPGLEAIVRQAAALLATPIAAVTLLDRTYMRFKASVGLGVPYSSRDSAFCGYAILQPEPLVVLDAHTDPRFADNPLVRGQPGIRFYAGVSVFGRDNLPFGALCVIDTVERRAVDEAALRSLRALADKVSAIMSTSTRRLTVQWEAGPKARQIAITSSEWPEEG